MEALLDANETLTIRKVDIHGWQSEVARQYGITGIPHLRLYRDGKLIAKGGPRVVLERLR